MKNQLFALVVAVGLLSPAAVAAQSATRVIVVSGVTSDGRATDLWLAILRRRLDQAAYDSVAPLVRPLTAAEQAWADTVHAHAVRWSAEVAGLTQPFDLESVPDSVRLVLGNRGSEDAFTHDSLTIGFDLSALQRVYGAADSGDNPAKVDRFFRHEFSHTLQKRYLARRPFIARSPLDEALLDIWLEGLGNRYSLGPRWQQIDGQPSAPAAAALNGLQPLFIERMSALACADSATGVALLQGLSSGPFDRKWGAVPAALWLQSEAAQSPDARRRFVDAGPQGIWQLAHRHLPPDLADRLAKAERDAAHCSAP